MNLIKRAKSSLFLYIGIIFILLGISLNFLSHGKVLSTHTVALKPSPKVAKTITPSPTTVVSQTNKTDQPASSPTSVPSNPSTHSQSISTNIPTPQPTSIPSTPATHQDFSVSLNINGSNAGQVNVQNGQNQCDVLNDALAQGKISSLNMRYNSSVGSYAVYQINGVGDASSVWWTYKVNGNEPAGCSYVKANSNDNIEWDYVGK